LFCVFKKILKVDHKYINNTYLSCLYIYHVVWDQLEENDTDIIQFWL